MSQTPPTYILCTELQNYLRAHTKCLHDEMLKYSEYNFNFPIVYKEYEEEILNLDCFPDDVWVVTYPKTGTTWVQEMVWLLVNNLDYNGAKVDMLLRAPQLEHPAIVKVHGNKYNVIEEYLLQSVKCLESPRCIKTHVPVGLLPQKIWEVKPKIIYVMRNPKDVAASYLNHYRLFSHYSGTNDNFFEAFLSDEVLIGSYWAHVASFWKLRHEPNILIITYEDMKHDLPSVIRQTANFLERTVPEDEMDRLVKHLSFDKMRTNDAVNLSRFVNIMHTVYNIDKDLHYLNRGIVENFKQVMSEEWISRFTEWEKQEKVKYNLNDKDFPY